MPTTQNFNPSAQAQAAFEQSAKWTQDQYDQVANVMQDFLKQTYPNLVDAYEEGIKQNKLNLDAAMQSLALTLKGAEQISQACWGFSQDIIQDQMSAAKTMMGCKNMKDLIDMQSDVVKSTVEKCMTESSKISEMCVKVANEAVQPIQKRANQAVHTAAKSGNTGATKKAA